MKERLRTFVAVELPGGIRASLSEEIARLAEAGADVKWVGEENLHVTLKFLGQVDRHAVAGILKGLEAATRESSPFRMECRGLVFFPKPVKPRVVAAGVDEDGARALAELASRVEDSLVPLGYKKDERGFRGHVTLGRVRSPNGLKGLSDSILTYDGEPFGEADVDAVALFMSELRRDGPVYTALGHARLGGGLSGDGQA